VGEDLLVQRAQLGAGFGAELADQGVPDCLVGSQRIALAAVTVEGEHQPGVQALS